MENKNNLDPVLEKIEWHADGHLFGFGLSPEADWKVIFVSTVTLIVIVSMLNIFMFLRVDRGGLSREEALESEVPSLDLESLKGAVNYYQNKSKEFERIRNGTVTVVVDPSL